jgi:hypothetical protein
MERDDGILGTRMREVKEDELKRCLADVLYTCVVKNLGDYNVSLTPSVYKFQLKRMCEAAPSEVPLLLEVPSGEARHVVMEHVHKVTRDLPQANLQTPMLLPKLGMAQVRNT